MRKLRLLLAAGLMLATVGLPALASADVNDFTVNDFTADETLSRKDRQGELHIVERLQVDFRDNNHGILRAIPQRYKTHSLQLKINQVKSESDAPAQYTTYSSNGNTVLKIGDPDRTVTGPQQYTLDYSVRNVIGFYDDFDELYWDVNGDQWQQEFKSVTVQLYLPAGLKIKRPPVCYTGAFGGTGRDCTIANDGQTITIATTKPLASYQTLTYAVGFEKGYFQPSTWAETIGEYSNTILAFLLPLIVISGSGALYWWRWGRDPKGRGTIIPQYEPPAGFKPLAAGALADFQTDSRDISATIIDLAIRGYIKIIESKKVRMLRKDKLSYKLKLVNNDQSGLDPHELKLLKALFDDMEAGSTTDLSKRAHKLYTTASSLQTDVEKQLVKDGYLRSTPFVKWINKRRVLYILLVIALVVVAIILSQPAGFIGAFLGLFIAIMFLAASDARSPQGVEAKEHLLGLKMYLQTAEKDRIAKLQAPDAPYASNADAPVKTVELFEKLLPFAVVFAVEKEWANQFEALYTAPPNWYSGSGRTFNSAYIASSLSGSLGESVNQAFSAPSSSGGSGSGGGGFSGGGGGGGGGGGW